jgi:GAF domain-containing protein
MDLEDGLTPKLYQFLATAIEIMNAEKGNAQFFDEKANCLKIVAHIGFNDEFLQLFKSVTPGHAGACGQAFKSRQRFIVEDTSKAPEFSSLGDTLKRFGFAAVQSTPLFDENRKFFGMLSTHFRHPHRPSQKELEMLDRYLFQSAPVIARKLRETPPREIKLPKADERL